MLDDRGEVAELAEGAPLLREYGLIAHRGFESHPLRHHPFPGADTITFRSGTSYDSAGYVNKTLGKPLESSELLLGWSPYAPVAQLDRALGCGPGGRTFESCRARHSSMRIVFLR
jgi:hypothetical protein